MIAHIIIKDDLPQGIEIVYRTDGGIFNLACLKSARNTSASSLTEFQYANDNCVAALSENHLQQILTAFNLAYTKLGLSVNTKKTQVTYQRPPAAANLSQPSIVLGETVLENVDHFSFLGSYLSSSVDLDDEIQHRLKFAVSA